MVDVVLDSGNTSSRMHSLDMGADAGRTDVPARQGVRSGPPKRGGETRGPVRVRHEPPTVEEAIAAAEGITTDREAQAEIAANLMGLPLGAVQSLMVQRSREAARGVRRTGRTVVVERRSRATLRRSA